jgi:hypothetical protein
MDMDASWELITTRANALVSKTENGAQQVLSPNGPTTQHPSVIQLIHQSPSSLLLHVPPSYVPILDTLLPPQLVPVALPQKPLAAGWDPVPEHLVKHLANITAHLSFSPELDRIVSKGIVLDDIRRNVRWLTGEAPSGIESRHSFTEGAIKAAHWIKGKPIWSPA